MDRRDVRITGGTFALCLWLLLLSIAVDRCADYLYRIAVALERAYPPAAEQVKP